MKESHDPLYLDAVRALTKVFDSFGGRGVLIGGVAVGLLTTARYTKDVDGMLVLDLDSVDRLVDESAIHGFRPMFSDAAEFARQSRVLALRHTATDTRVDLMLGCTPFEEEIETRAATIHLGDVTVRLATPEDIVILKAVASRDQDLVDIRTIATHYLDLDRSRIERWVREYGELLETPELWSEIEPLLEPE